MSIKTAENHPQISNRKRVYNLLNSHESDDKVAVILDCFLIMLILINVFAIIIETEANFYEEYGTYFYLLEIFSIIVFTIEYALRCWSSPEALGDKGQFKSRLYFIFKPMAIIDLLVIASFYLAFIFSVDLRILRILRLLQMFKLTRYSEAMSTMLKVILDEMSSFIAAISLMLVIMVIAASGIYVIEHDYQPEVFGSIPQSMWWSIVTLTTVGYGDVYPITIIGKVFAALIMIAGVGIVALPTGILASGFSKNLEDKRNKRAQSLKDALEDCTIDENEEKALADLRKELELSEEDFVALGQAIMKSKSHSSDENSSVLCPYCKKNINK